jgi:hypothetical protein
MHPDFSKPIQIICPFCFRVSQLLPCQSLSDYAAQYLATAEFNIKCGLCGEMMHLDSELRLRQQVSKP